MKKKNLKDGSQQLEAPQQEMRQKQGCALTVGAGMLRGWIHMEVSHRGICEIFGKGLQLKDACG